MLDAFRFDALVKHAGLIALVTSICMVLGIAYALSRPTTYTASAQVILDNRELQLNQQDTMVASVALDDPVVLSQMEIMRSERTGIRVAEALDLAAHPEFRSEPGWLASLTSLFDAGEAGPSDPTAINRGIAGALQRNLEIARVGGSYLVNVAYTSSDPELSASIANAVVRVYLEDQAQANRLAAQSATAWLRERMQTLGPSARVISDAAPPVSPDGPGLVKIVAAALVLGLILGLGLALLWELLDDRIRSPGDLSRVTDAEFLGALPRVSRDRRGSRFLRTPPDRPGISDGGAGAMDLPWVLGQGDQDVMATLRRVCIAAMPAEAEQGATVLGVTSVSEGDGKTTAAVNLARIMAMSGRRVLLVDCNPMNATLSHLLAPGAKAGLAEALAGQVLWSQAVWAEAATRLHVLPASAGDAAPRVVEGIWLGPMQRLLEEIGPGYDHIVLDLPAMMPAPDVRAASRLVDSLLLVVSFGTTPVRQAYQALRTSGEAEGKVLGVVLNKVQRTMLQRLSDRLLGRAGWRAAYAE